MTFEKIFSEVLKPVILAKTLPKVHIEEWPFRLHFRITAILLIVCSALVCLKENIGEHIKCQPNHEDDSNDPIIPRKVIETYCFIQTTFTIPYDVSTTSVAKIKTDMNLGGPQYRPGKSERLHHAYYQWVPYYLFFLALCFYLTHWVWKCIENSKLRMLVEELNKKDFLSTSGVKRTEKINAVVQYIVKSKGTHGFWAFCYVACEFGNLIVVIGTLYITDAFLGKEFSTYGPRVLQFLEDDPESRIDPMATVFPRITKCLFHMYGPSGSIQRFDALCVLPLNILNEKIFTFLWFWFVILTVVTIISLLHRIFTIVSEKFRLHGLFGSFLPRDVKSVNVVKRLRLSDWFLLRLLRINLDEDTFNKLITEIYDELNL